MFRKHAEGFTLIELLVVVAVIGIITAIAIPNLISAIDRGKQKRTMADLRSLSTALETYSIDVSRYPTATTMNDLAAVLEPRYITIAPRLDGWGHAFIVAATAEDYTICSPGKAGGSACSLTGSGGATSDFDDDIILYNGQFSQWPEGQQQ